MHSDKFWKRTANIFPELPVNQRFVTSGSIVSRLELKMLMCFSLLYSATKYLSDIGHLSALRYLSLTQCQLPIEYEIAWSCCWCLAANVSAPRKPVMQSEISNGKTISFSFSPLRAWAKQGNNTICNLFTQSGTFANHLLCSINQVSVTTAHKTNILINRRIQCFPIFFG